MLTLTIIRQSAVMSKLVMVWRYDQVLGYSGFFGTVEVVCLDMHSLLPKDPYIMVNIKLVHFLPSASCLKYSVGQVTTSALELLSRLYKENG